MSVPRTAANVLRQHVTLEVEGIDRMYLNVYQPRLPCEGQVAAFFRHHRGHTFASSALMDPMSKAFSAAVTDFTRQQGIPLFSFTPGQRKEEVALEHRARFRGMAGILFVGKAQEKTPVFRTEKRKNPKTGQTFPWIVRSTALVNHFYGVDKDCGPFFLTFCTYFPYNAKLCINEHEYVKRQLAQEGIGRPSRPGESKLGGRTMSEFMAVIESFINAVKGDQAWVEELNDHSQKIAKHYSKATAREVNDSLGRLASLFPDVPLVALGHVAITCGSLVERGGDPEIAGPVLLDRLARVNETATDFYHRCRALAESDAELVEELRTEAAEHTDEDVDASKLTATEIIDSHVANQGWQHLRQRFGPTLFKTHPASVLGHMAEGFFRLGLIAHLSRSKVLRNAARARTELLGQTIQADEAANAHPSFLAIMLQVLDDEPLLVVHVEQRKGFAIRIAGVANNFQLHTLLAGAIIGSPAKGLVTGEAPSKRAVAECRDALVGQQGGDYVTGAFNLWNWNGLQSDGRLPDSLNEGSTHWIWNEGCPADIVSFEGRRVVLLGPPPYSRHWRAGRLFHGMVGELTIERQLGKGEVSDFLNRLTRASHP